MSVTRADNLYAAILERVDNEVPNGIEHLKLYELIGKLYDIAEGNVSNEIK